MPTQKHQAKHFFYASGWKKFEMDLPAVSGTCVLEIVPGGITPVLAKHTKVRSNHGEGTN